MSNTTDPASRLDDAATNAPDDIARPTNKKPSYDLAELGAILVGTVTETQRQ